MRLSEAIVAKELFGAEHCVHVKCLVYRLRCLGHRLLTFGFEDFVNTYAPRELVMLAALPLPSYQHAVLIREAHRRADAPLKAWLEGKYPELRATLTPAATSTNEVSHG